MFGVLENLTKAALSVAATPITAVVDLSMLPADAFDGEAGQRTMKKLDQAAAAFDAAVNTKGESK